MNLHRQIKDKHRKNNFYQLKINNSLLSELSQLIATELKMTDRYLKCYNAQSHMVCIISDDTDFIKKYYLIQINSSDNKNITKRVNE